jgi:hypothetical protein
MFAIDSRPILGALSKPAIATRESSRTLLATQVEERVNDG